MHFSGGVIEAHFYFFVMIVLLTLYEDWLPFGVAVGYVVLHHGLLGAIDPASVYNHADAQAHPWKWAGIHGAFVLMAGAAGVVSWRLNEDARAETIVALSRARRSEEDFSRGFDGAPIGMVFADADGRLPARERRVLRDARATAARTPAHGLPGHHPPGRRFQRPRGLRRGARREQRLLRDREALRAR